MFTLIQSLQSEMTEAEFVVSQKVLENPDIILESSITNLAEKYNVSRNAISRFCQKLGFAGYTDFKYEFKKWWHTVDLKQSESTITPANNIIQTVAHHVSILMDEIDEKSIIDFVEEIKLAKRVVVLASGKSLTASEQFQRRFHQLGKTVLLINYYYMPGDLEYFFEPDDVIVVFSVTGVSAFTNHMLDAASKVSKNIYYITMAKTIQYKVKQQFTLPVFSRKNMPYIIDNQTLFLIMIDLIINYYLLEKTTMKE